MKKVFNVFHYISLVKYPIMIYGLYYMNRYLFVENPDIISDYNTGFILMGIGIGLDSLKDYDKLTWLDKKVYHNPKRASIYLVIVALSILTIILVGLYFYLSTEETAFKELSIGFIVLGIGSIGVLKAGMQATKDYMNAKTQGVS